MTTVVAPRWVRPSVAVLLLGTAALYLTNVAISGWGNDFYAMAGQAGTGDWKAWFFGSLDPGNVVTVDKPPLSLWVMGLSGRIFGFSSWSMLVPDALAGVGSVGLLYLAVRRLSGPVAGLLAGALLALTPVAALMFRFNNPDAFLVLLLVAGGYFLVRALEKASTRWLLLAGVAIGFGFLDKMLQAFLVLPAFVLAYAVAAPTSVRRRVWQLLAAAGAVVVSAGWWVLAVALWPVADRPYISGSTNNSVLELAFGYNGLGRIFGQSHGGDARPKMPEFSGAGHGFGGQAGLTRLFTEQFGGEASWLLPAALVGLVAGLWFTRRAPRTDRTRAALLLWGAWTVISALVFSYMSGIIHPYYTVALAPGIAATVAISATELWRGRAYFAPRVVLAVMLAATVAWSFVLLHRTPNWQPWVRYSVLVLGVLGVFALLIGIARRAAAVLALVAALLGMASFTVATASTAHTGGSPASGPQHNGRVSFGGPQQSNVELYRLLETTTTKWAAAETGAMQAAGLALNSGKPVLAVGGFSGSDPAPTLARFQQYVASGEIHYFVVGARNGRGGSRGTSGKITAWVEQHFQPTTVGGATVYDLTRK
ncbi:phospholipid carrier-dependent glycosyltransferase [Amycolatopsis rubida]|uniref:4-amino-4-deoxy-L-arabinose transferase n=1 Tax=Amycolatopsis rubida TaxID=112413 RepID=A0A1I5G122_9PSEU|nr:MULTISPECIES: glycosyltransferase family 39 protein [Amycolatopsis]MYW92164.1 phospholipid carrier-dependent glycosyltransferase [Amycolatopsis rubida]NEC57151.1 phospholipid carrier-dependent glycosyltransferase [Amycolatopsis rubida]OAP27667.1 Dolichyl-phosphate-mannose-protein mannosyltransferase [Amycolatopsis sp. M39]SFO29714.1 4-amino-4-deoxy-L-arabinose transferase [Amycolatopsis rubida]